MRAWPVRRAELQSLQSFDLHGRVAVSSGDEGFSARLRWNQAAGRSEIALDGPLGVGGVRITSDGEQLTVINSKGETLDRDAAQAEMHARLGFEPPIAQLRYWMLGVPAPGGEPHETVDPEGRLLVLEQDGWHVDYSDYRVALAESVPARVTLTRGPLRVRLIVDGWDR